MSVRTQRGPAFSRPRSKLRKWLPALLLLGAIGCLLGAFLQFRVSREVTRATVILVFDASKSMNRTDVEPSRLAAAQAAARTFLEQVPADFRVGLVSFAGSVTRHAEPSLDRDRVAREFDVLPTSSGTLIGDGLDATIEFLLQDWRANGRGPAAVLLLSDGQDTGSAVSPLVAAERARTLGVPVFTVHLGEEEIDDTGASSAGLLQAMATTTEAEAFTADTADELNRVYEDLGSELSTRLAVTDIGVPFLIAAGVLALAAGVALVRGSEGADWR